MSEELLYEKGDVLVRRAILEPGESSAWHTDSCDRVTVILSGDRLAIEFRDGRAIHEFDAPAGQVDWDGPASAVHRAINVGRRRYEEEGAVRRWIFSRLTQQPLEAEFRERHNRDVTKLERK